MNLSNQKILSDYCNKYDFIHLIKDDIVSAFDMLNNCYLNGGKVIICGNGGSAADADHIVGELMKGFNKKRKLCPDIKNALAKYGDTGIELSEKLQSALPAINLSAHTSLLTAIINDIGGDEIYAQQVLGFGCENDVLIGISTSGNSKNILNACVVAKALKLKTLAITGEHGGEMNSLFDICLKMPSKITHDIQDMHSAVYHLLCFMIEAERWEE